MSKGAASRALGPSTEQRLRPARQPGGDRAEVVAADDRNARQLLLQRGAQQGERALPPVR